MTEFYFDMETYSPSAKPVLDHDKIIAIQYQELSSDGRPRGKLEVLTEWNFGSEKAMLEAFAKVFLTDNPWDFVPIGFNLIGFDLVSLLSKFNLHLGTNFGFDWFYTKPVLDIKPLLVLVENGSFSRSSDIFGKREKNLVREWYALGKPGQSQILAYVEHEASMFIRLYQALKWEMPRLRPQLQKVIA